jgi:serine/threonine protein phosphatase PrpC
MLTHVGAVRSINEDTVAYVLPRNNDPLARQGALLVVADGMGGHAAGEVASKIAAETILWHYYDGDGPTPKVLTHCFAMANDAIHQRSLTDPDCAGMGTTCTAIAVLEDQAYLAHVGDSRAYILRNGELHQLSVDHTLVAELVRQGVLTEQEAALSPDRNVIVKALGTRPEVEPYVWTEGMPLHTGDRLLLCSDGLSDLVDIAAINEIIGNHEPFDACEALIEMALRGGGHDNISAGVFVIVDNQAEQPRPERPTRKLEAADLAVDTT